MSMSSNDGYEREIRQSIINAREPCPWFGVNKINK